MEVAACCQLAPLRRPPQLDRYITNSCGMFVILERSRWVLLLRKMGGWARENVPILKNQRFYSCLSMLNSSEGMGPWYGRTFWGGAMEKPVHLPPLSPARLLLCACAPGK